MARDGKKLELYEILAAKRAKGKAPLALDPKTVRQPAPQEPEVDAEKEVAHEPEAWPGIIVDDSISPESIESDWTPKAAAPAETPRSGVALPRARPQSAPVQARYQPRTTPLQEVPPPPAPEQRQRSPREVVFALDTAFIFFTVVLALVGSSYFLGYKRGQEERPTGMAGIGEIEAMGEGRLSLRHLAPAPRPTMRPPDQDFTLVLRTEIAGEDTLERLELELGEAVALGSQRGGGEFPGFIFRTGGASPLYVLAVGLGKTINDPDLEKLLKVYYEMEGVTLSREPYPYRSGRVAPIRELGTPVF